MAYSTWIVGIDGSEDSHTALRWAARRATGRDVVIVALMAWDLPTLAIGSLGTIGLARVATDLEDAARMTLDHAFDGFDLASNADLKIERVVDRGRASDVLLRHAESADLVVLGSRGLGGLGRLILGSVSQRVAENSPTPTIVVPQDTAIGEMKRVLVGIDGSDNSALALRWALENTQPDVQIEALGAWKLSASIREQIDTSSATTLSEAIKLSVHHVVSEVKQDFPTRPITETIQHVDAVTAIEESSPGTDLIVLGAHGSSGFLPAALGSVSRSVLHMGLAPTAIIPIPREEQR